MRLDPNGNFAHDVAMHLGGWSTQEVSDAMEELCNAFVAPEVRWFGTDDEIPGCGEPGWYYRLSASGYMDCTEWHGGFENEAEAVADMIFMYAD